MAAAAPVCQFEPEDQYNRTLADDVRPSDWVNPVAKRRYNLVVVGGGTAGLVTAAGAAGLGASVALVERDLLGGDCLNFGCVPSKALIRTARAAAEMRDAAAYGIQPVDIRVDFGRVMERMRRLRAELSAKDSARRYRDELGVDVFIGEARFTSANTVEVDGHAGEMLSELTLAIARGVGLGAVATVIHPYPTQAEAIKKVADAFNRTRLTPRVKRLFSMSFSLTG